jgi:spore coat polysaccharide biosynthesis protein SpsF
MELNTILVTQARTGSSRLPKKVMKEINGKSLLEIHLERLKKCKKVSQIIVATTTSSDDDIIYQKAIEWGYGASRGSENDVLDRYYQAVKGKEVDYVVRVTSDCPLIDPILVDEIIEFTQKNNIDYCSNVLIENFPDGQDVEVFKFKALEKAWTNSSLLSEREHVTPYIKNNSNFRNGNEFTAMNYPCDSEYNHIRMTVDEIRDFELISQLINKLGIEKTWLEYTNYIIENNLIVLNDNIIRNEGYMKSLIKDKQ